MSSNDLRRLSQFLVIALAIWGLVAMPVNYTGGGSIAHPHAFVQFLREAQTGSMSHHAPPDILPVPLNHHTPLHESEPTGHVEAVEDAPLVSPPSQGIARLTLNAAAQPAVVLLLLFLATIVWLSAAWRPSRVVRPPFPPPRCVA